MSTPNIGARRAPIRLVLAALVAIALGALTVAPAQAATYRFWGFYQLTQGAWTFAQRSPDQITPKDGDVEGWRYAVVGDTDTRVPRDVLTFDQICGATPEKSGSKRVGLVIDYGRRADSADGSTPPKPEAVCAVVDTGATSLELLSAATETRIENGLVCGISGHPAAECGGEVSKPSAAAQAEDEPITIAAPNPGTKETTAAPKPSASTATATPEKTTAAATATTTAAATPTPSAAATPNPATESTSSGTSTAAYVIAGLALLAILGFVIARSRAAARRDA